MKINHSKPYLDTRDEKSLVSVIKSAFLSTGNVNIELGKLISKLLDKKFAIPTQSGTDAISAGLNVLNIPKNGKIGVPAYICSAPLDAIHLNKSIPHPIDIDRKTLAISAELANQEKDLDAIIAAHLFGIPAPFYQLKHLNIIEDCAQTLNISIDNHKVGSMGKIAICSFYATKLLTTGHGGAIAVNDEALFNKIKYLFCHDNQEEWAPHLHYSLSDLNASLGVSQISKLQLMIDKRRMIAKRFLNSLDNSAPLPNSIFSRFIVVAENSIDKLLHSFNSVGIEAKRPVYKPLFQYLNLNKKEFPNAQWAHDHIISIPIYPGMNENEIQYIETFLEKHKNEMRCWPST